MTSRYTDKEPGNISIRERINPTVTMALAVRIYEFFTADSAQQKLIQQIIVSENLQSSVVTS